MNVIATPLFGPVGPELLIIIAIIVLLFGASRIPNLANAVGKSFGSFKQGREEIEAELNEVTDEVNDLSSSSSSDSEDQGDTKNT